MWRKRSCRRLVGEETLVLRMFGLAAGLSSKLGSAIRRQPIARDRSARQPLERLPLKTFLGQRAEWRFGAPLQKAELSFGELHFPANLF